MTGDRQAATAPAEYADFAAAAYPDLLRFAASMSGNVHDGSDLVQDCFIRLAASWHRVDAGRNPAAYARRTIVRLYLNRLRARSGEHRTLLRLVRQTRPEPVAAPTDATLWDPWLADAFAGLSDRQRTAIALVHLWGYSAKEAAELMRCSENSVRTHLSRGLTALRASAPLAADNVSHQ